MCSFARTFSNPPVSSTTVRQKTNLIARPPPAPPEKQKQVEVWNATISNLTLMALGSSAPEILLAVIETLGTISEPPEEGLGPSCIVGSAAFNLLVISAICVVAIGGGDVRRIKQFGVFNITAFFSIFAYVWMYIVLMDEEVLPWEAWVTLAFAPIMTGLAYGQDQKWIWCRSTKYKIAHSPSKIALDPGLGNGRDQDKIRFGAQTTTGTYVSAMVSKSIDHSVFKEAMEKRADELGIQVTDVDPNEVAQIVAQDIADKAPKSRAHYRINANKAITGGGRKKISTFYISSCSPIADTTESQTHLPSLPLPPRVTLCKKEHRLPITAVSPTTTPVA